MGAARREARLSLLRRPVSSSTTTQRNTSRPHQMSSSSSSASSASSASGTSSSSAQRVENVSMNVNATLVESPVTQLPAYYTDLQDDEISHSIQNFDDPPSFQHLEAKMLEGGTNNFMIDFGEAEAWAAFDLGAGSFKKLVTSPRPQALYTRWINIWKPSTQIEALKTLAKHYEFSPRLLGIMCSPQPAPLEKTSDSAQNSSILRRFAKPIRGRGTSDSRRSGDSPPKDGEKYDKASEMEASLGASSANDPTHDDKTQKLFQELNHYRIVDEVWHWSSIDWGRHYVCLGYNSLYVTEDTGLIAEQQNERDLPSGRRIWNWLLLCQDKTVISISEDPFPYHVGPFDKKQLDALKVIRRNAINIFRQLSLAHDSTKDNPIQRLPIRKRVGNSKEETAHRATDAPGLLMYCIFDDWYGTYSLVARREQRFAHELSRLREEMLETAELEHINRLHHLRQQLAVLKRLYQSYELLIERVLEKQEPTPVSLKNSQVVSGDADQSADLDDSEQVHEMDSLLGVGLSSAARARFERLKHRIRLYALSEIQECLDQQDSLVMMNFNLIAIKESYSVERLTRVTLLLAKVTILFMPVSVSTAFFGTSIVDANFTLKQYWISFAVVVTLSILLLFGFSLISGTMEGKVIYRPLGRKMLDAWRAVRKQRKEKKQQ